MEALTDTRENAPGPIPENLLLKCRQTVAAFHDEYGIGDLSRRLASRRNMRALWMVPGGRAITAAAFDAFKWRMGAWCAGTLAVALGAIFSGWILLALLPVVLADRRLELRQQRQWQAAAAILVALEILATDYAGWGSADPQARESAVRILHSEFDKSEWLRCYCRISELRVGERGDSARVQPELIQDAAV